jgi:outer membrane protein assembly factor BamB
MRHAFAILVMTAVFCLSDVTSVTADSQEWLRFRGPNGTGISDSTAPIEFGQDKNMKWKLDLPGRGVSSPIVVGDRVFVTCYSGYGVAGAEDATIEELKRHLVCVDRTSGEIAWTATEAATMPEDEYSGMGVPAHGYASHTPTSDGERVYAFFGKSGVFAYDLDGNRLWQKEVGKESGRMRWGSASSPILHDGILIVLASDEAETMYGFDAKTGEEVWKAEAAGFASTWGTPALAKGEKGTEVVVAVPEETWGLNAKTGKVRWYAPGNGGGSHSVVIADGFAYSIGGSRGGGAAVAVSLGGSGEIEDVAWEQKAASRFATPLVYQGRIYSVAGSIVACYDAKSGDKIFEERLPQTLGSKTPNEKHAEEEQTENKEAETDRPRRGRGGRGGRRGMSYASPVLAGGNLYITDASGKIYVVSAKPEFEVLAMNDLSFDTSGFHGTPAISDGHMFLRSHKALYCIGE